MRSITNSSRAALYNAALINTPLILLWSDADTSWRIAIAETHHHHYCGGYRPTESFGHCEHHATLFSGLNAPRVQQTAVRSFHRPSTIFYKYSQRCPFAESIQAKYTLGNFIMPYNHTTWPMSIFCIRKIDRLGPGSSPQPWVQKASDKSTTPPSRRFDN
ncbi:hypothetical protein TNCV_455661 [Trichonephila clavipes]|nr:hypothetical protein TNCV_455661 [Trichonephila clavipes]